MNAGLLAEQPLTQLLAQYHRERLTGVVQIMPLQPDAEVQQVWLQRGYPVEVLSSTGSDPLGAVLYEVGVFDRDRYLRAQMLHPIGSQRIGHALIRARLLTPPELKEGLRAQTRRRVQRLLSSSNASFQVFSGSHKHGVHDGEPLLCETPRILYFGLRSICTESQLMAALRPLHGQEMRTSVQFAADVARWKYPAERRACELLARGFYTLAEIGEASELPNPALLALLHAAWLCGNLDTRAAVLSRPQRLVRPAAKLTALEPAPLDLPGQAGPLPVVGRPVALQAAQQQISAAPLPRPRRIVIVPVSGQASGSSPRPPIAAVPQDSPRSPISHDSAPKAPPPLRTSLPASRLPNKPPTE